MTLHVDRTTALAQLLTVDASASTAGQALPEGADFAALFGVLTTTAGQAEPENPAPAQPSLFDLMGDFQPQAEPTETEVAAAPGFALLVARFRERLTGAIENQSEGAAEPAQEPDGVGLLGQLQEKLAATQEGMEPDTGEGAAEKLITPLPEKPASLNGVALAKKEQPASATDDQAAAKAEPLDAPVLMEPIVAAQAMQPPAQAPVLPQTPAPAEPLKSAASPVTGAPAPLAATSTESRGFEPVATPLAPPTPVPQPTPASGPALTANAAPAEPTQPSTPVSVKAPEGSMPAGTPRPEQGPNPTPTPVAPPAAAPIMMAPQIVAAERPERAMDLRQASQPKIKPVTVEKAGVEKAGVQSSGPLPLFPAQAELAMPELTVPSFAASGITLENTVAEAPSPTDASPINIPAGMAPLETDRPEWEADLVSRIAAKFSDEGTSISMELTPDNLGNLEVSLDVRDGQAEVRFLTETREAARLLTQAEGRLSDMLARSGFNLAGQDASARDQSGGERQQNPANARRQDPPTEAEQPKQPPAHSGGLNLIA